MSSEIFNLKYKNRFPKEIFQNVFLDLEIFSKTLILNNFLYSKMSVPM